MAIFAGARRFADPSSGRDLIRHAGALVLVGAAYYVGARVGLTLSLVERNVTPLWPPTGIAVAAFLLLGRSTWPGVAVAAFAVNLPISEGPIAAAVTAAGNTLAPLVAVTLLARVGFRPQMDRRQDAWAIVFLAALTSTLISATIGAGTLVASGAISANDLGSAWAVWWTGDAMGVLTVAPFLLSLALFRELPGWSPARWLEAFATLLLAAGVAAWATQSELHLLYLVMPVVGWAAWRLQLRGAAPVALVVSLVATRSAADEVGAFAHENLLEQMLSLQGFNACVALTSFFLSALVSERNRTSVALQRATVELEDRVQQRTAELSAANEQLLQEVQERSRAEEHLSREEARGRRTHEIAEALQRRLLPDRIPRIPAIALAARYVPATADMEVGGDWYDVIQLHDGRIGLAIGDVAGHGPHAAATMGQLRMAVRAYALQDPSPVSVMSSLHELVSQLPLPEPELVTLTYLVFDPASGRLVFTNAGHPPPLVLGRGQGTYLEDGLSPPLGVGADATYTEASRSLGVGETLLLYTDGLVERRGESMQDGLDRLLGVAVGRGGSDVDDLCDHILASLIESDHVADDIALVAMRRGSSSPGERGPEGT